MSISRLHRTDIPFAILFSVGLICATVLGGCASDKGTGMSLEPSEPGNGTELTPSDTSGEETPEPGFEPTGPSGTEYWRLSMDKPVLVPVVGPDGTVYVNTEDGSVHAVSPKGEELWVFRVEEGVASPPAVNRATGVIYVGSGSKRGVLYALQPDGTMLWKTVLPAKVLMQPVIGPSGLVYVGSSKGLYAIDRDGAIRWSRIAMSGIAGLSEVTPDKVICAVIGNTVYALSLEDGTEFWRFETESFGVSPPCVGEDGTIYFGTGDGYVYALHPDGTKRWRFDIGEAITFRPAVGEDGTVYVGTMARSVHAILPEGVHAWRFATERSIPSWWSGPVVGSDGTVYVSDAKVYALSSEGEELWHFQTGGAIAGIALGSGVIYFGSYDRNLYAVYQ